MIVKLKLYTTSIIQWFHPEFAYLKRKLMEAKGVTGVEFVVEHIKLDAIPLFPQGPDRLPSWLWFRETLTAKAKGYNAVCLHFTSADYERFGIKGAAGAYSPDTDDVFEFWLCADKGQRSAHYWQGERMTEFSRIFLHELGGHGFAAFTKAPDITHEMDFGPGGASNRATYHLPDLPAAFDFTEYDKAMKGRLNFLGIKLAWLQNLYQSLINSMNRPRYPLDAKYFANVTQAFGVRSAHYKSGMHNGTDFGCPIGTPVYAPTDGKIVNRYGNHTTMGGAVYYTCVIDGIQHYMRFLHLSVAGEVGSYKKGDVIGKTGNTGDSTGPHLHHDVWNSPIDTGRIATPANVLKRMVDPVIFWREKVEGITN